MATNLNIDDKLLKKAKRLAGFRTKRETVDKALEEFIQHREQQDILKYEGKVDFWPEFDKKKPRKAR